MKIFKMSITMAALALTAACLSSCYVRISDKAKEEMKNNFDSMVEGSADLDSAVFRPGKFNAIAQAGSMDIEFIPTDVDPRVVVTTSSNLIPCLNVAVDENDMSVLSIKYSNKVNNVQYHKAVIYYPSVNVISNAGSGDFEIFGGFKGDSLRIVSSGSGDFTIHSMKLSGNLTAATAGSGDFSADDLNVRSLVFKSAGSGDANISGKGETASFSSAGSGDIDASDFIAGKIEDMSQKGSGSLRCNGDGKAYTWDNGDFSSRPK